MTRPPISAAASFWLRLTGVGLLALMQSTPAWTQDGRGTGGIYSCVDSKGRRLTSDRPIVDCLDREQRELGQSGTVKRVLPPSYTAEEKAKLEAQRKIEEAEKARIAEEKRRNKALKQVDEVIEAVKKRVTELGKQRKEIDQELEFYQNDPKKAPAWLQRKLEDNTQQVQVQNRFLSEQAQEKQRINARFDEELTKLKVLWTYGLKP